MYKHIPNTTIYRTYITFRDGVRLRLVASRGDGPGIEATVIEAGRLVLGEPVTLS
jgi:hypothetical protein